MLNSENAVAKNFRRVRQPRERKGHYWGRIKLRNAARARTFGATWKSGCETKRQGGAVVKSHGIALGGENPGEDKCPRGARPASGAKPILAGTDS